MAALSDIPKIIKRVGLWKFAMRVWREVENDNLFTWSAALAYAWLFAIFPFMITLLSMLPYLPDRAKDGARKHIYSFAYEAMSKEAADTVWRNVEDVLDRPKRSILGFGLALSIFAASGGMNMTITAMDRAYDLERGRPFYWQRLLAIALTLIVGALIISLLVFLPLGTIVIKWMEAHGQVNLVRNPLAWAARIIRYPIALLIMLLVVNILYHFGPAVKQKYRFLTPGSVFCVGVWIALGFAFRMYLDTLGKAAKYKETYGAVGGVVILLLFFYIEATVLLVGAEINSEIDYELNGAQRGSRDFTGGAGPDGSTQAKAPDGAEPPPGPRV